MANFLLLVDEVDLFPLTVKNIVYKEKKSLSLRFLGVKVLQSRLHY